LDSRNIQDSQGISNERDSPIPRVMGETFERVNKVVGCTPGVARSSRKRDPLLAPELLTGTTSRYPVGTEGREDPGRSFTKGTRVAVSQELGAARKAKDPVEVAKIPRMFESVGTTTAKGPPDAFNMGNW
jgi:hypothetical protein